MNDDVKQIADAASSGYFLDTQDEPRVRRARDAVQLGIGLLLLLVAASDVVRLSSLQESINGVSAALPGWAGLIFWSSYALAALYALGIIAVSLVRARRNPKTARDIVAAGAAAIFMTFMIMQWKEGIWPRLLPELGAETPEPHFPVLRVAVVAAVVLASSPHTTRALRRFGLIMIALTVVASFGLNFGYPSDAIGALGIGMIAAGAVLLGFGSPGGFPEPAVVAGALGQLGIVVHDLLPAADQSWGTRRLVGHDGQGAEIEVKAYGRDAADTQWAAKVWRALWYRDSGPPMASRMQAVEHEALMSLFADRAGMSVAEPLTAGLAGDDVAILAVHRPGPALASVDPEEVSDTFLTSVWQDLVRLHSADMAHGSPRTEAIMVTSDGHVFDDFVMGSLGAGDRINLDVVNLLFSLAAWADVDRAVATARAGLGDERLAAALPYLQLPALDRRVRRATPKPKNLMKDLGAAVAAATETEPPEEVKLRRVSVGSVLMALLILIAANALITQLAGIDFAAVWDVVRDAAPLGILLAYFVAHLSFVPEATGMIAAVGRPLPLQPVVILQLSARFIGLAVPSAAGRVAMNSAFLMKFGVGPTAAVVQGAIDGISGFIVEAFILVIGLMFIEGSFDLGGDVDWQAILLIALAVVVVGVTILFLVERLRKLVLPVLKDALGSVTSVLKDPRRAITLLTSNFLARLALAVALWLILRSIGIELSVALVLVVTVATNLLAGLVPIPGGIGIAEAVLTSWLVLVGVPETSAFAATVVYRMWTFYLPAVEGFFAMRWLERRDYL
ncbi:MAG: lysylphosphatidylglycerol synthase transmembrane domain-containing protein [Acidimicrobiia bacterium]|nr:lysylphosphatidylglycerol synthase transmembrane domain-containing protein [Acidimicrobiia bacterium]